MKLNITSESGEFATVQIDENMPISQVKIQLNLYTIHFNNVLLLDTATLKSSGVKEDDVLLVVVFTQDLRAQLAIEEEIQKKNIEMNLMTAMEYHPESFGRVIMLYIDCVVNGVAVKAFVDSGAQATIMSPECAEKCDLMRLCDTRFAGMAMGVGTAKILGRVHSAQLKLGKSHLPCTFTIMEGKDVDLLFGLDMLKRHQASIDLKNNVLIIGEDIVPFLNEHELPEKARIEKVHKPAPIDSTSSTVPDDAQTGVSQSGNIKPLVASFPESSIKLLTDLGVSREEALSALKAAKGNPDLAASMLF